MSQVNETATVDVIDQTSERSLVTPVDFVPDFAVIRYIDDLIVTAIAKLNLLQKWLENYSRVLAGLFRLMKWLVFFVGIIAVLLLGLVVWGISDLFKVHKEITTF